MVDAHFGIGRRQIDKYIREKGLSVVSPEYIAEELICDGGIKNTAVDFVRVNRKLARVRKWFHARENRTFDSIGTCADITSHSMGNSAEHVVTDKYSVASTEHYVIEEFSILSGGDNREDIECGHGDHVTDETHGTVNRTGDVTAPSYVNAGVNDVQIERDYNHDVETAEEAVDIAN